MLMDTRQLAAFCAVVERKSFSQAAERLGRQLLDRSGRRVEPTEAGRRLYASAQRLLAAEEHLLEDLDADDEGAITGTLELGASTGPGGTVVPLLLCEFQEQHPDVRVRLIVSDTQTVVDRVGERELELGIVGAGRRHRGVAFEPFFRDEVVLACPSAHRFAGKTISLDDLKGEKLIVMQEGAGVRQVIEDELRKAGMRLRDLDVHLELGLQESVRSAVVAGHGIAFISRLAIEADLDADRIATARVRGLDPVREIFLARASGRSETRAARAFISFAQEHLPA